MTVVVVDVEGVGVILVPDAALATERRNATLCGCACTGEAHDVLRLGEDFGGLLDFFFVIHYVRVVWLALLSIILNCCKKATVDVVVAKNAMTTFIVFGCKVREKRGKKK